MGRRSSVDRLSPEIRELIGKLRKDKGYTLDEILKHLEKLDVSISRSALGRHTKKIDAIEAKLEESRVVAEALVRRMGEEPESKTARLNMHLMHTAIYQVIDQALDGAGNKDAAGNFTPAEAMQLSRALDHLTRAAKTDAEHIAKIREEARKEACTKAAEAASVAGKQQGLNDEQIAFIRAEILGVEVQK